MHGWDLNVERGKTLICSSIAKIYIASKFNMHIFALH